MKTTPARGYFDELRRIKEMRQQMQAQTQREPAERPASALRVRKFPQRRSATR